jgi:hypothetical protein
VLATGKVRLVALVSVNVVGDGGDTSLASGMALLEGVLRRWPAP